MQNKFEFHSNTRIFENKIRIMLAKLTLTIEKSVIDQAKIVAKSSGRSLSKMIEQYLISLHQESASPEQMDLELKNLIAIRGCIKLPEDFDLDSIRYQGIMDKHS